MEWISGIGREAAKNVGIKKIGEGVRERLLCKLSEKKRAGDLCFDDNMNGQDTDRTQEQKDCSLEDQEGGAPYMQGDLVR